MVFGPSGTSFLNKYQVVAEVGDLNPPLGVELNFPRTKKEIGNMVFYFTYRWPHIAWDNTLKGAPPRHVLYHVGVHMYEIRLTTNYDYWGLCVHLLVHKFWSL